MSYSLRGHSSGGAALPAGATAITLPIATNAGDTIIVGVAVGGSGANSIVCSGAGATWAARIGNGGAPAAEIYIGYNASAGQTQFTLTPNAGASLGYYVVAVISGVKTSGAVEASVTSGTGSASSTVTSPSITFSTGDLLIEVAATGNGWNATPGAPVWSDGATDSQIDFTSNGNARAVWMSYAVPGSGTSTTATSVLPTSGGTVGISVAALLPAPSTANGNMLAVM